MDYPAYPVYRKSGIDWLGDIPNHWVFYRLRFTAKINPLKSEVSDLLPDKLVSFVPMEAIGEYGGIELSRVKPIESVYNGYSFFKDNDLLIAKITPCFENGKGAIATSLQNGIGFGTTELHVIRADQDFSKEFLFYLSISHSFRNIGESTMFGAGGQKRISEDFIKDFCVFFPSYAEQQTIAQFLDHKTQQIDQLIAKKQTLIDKLNEQRIALITHAVTKGLNPAVTLKGSGVEWLGEVPEHWEIRRLKFVTESFGGGTPNTAIDLYWNGDIPWVSPKDMKSRKITQTQDNITQLGLEESTSRMVNENAVLIVVRSGILRHSIPVAINLVPVSINQDMKALIPDDTMLMSQYLQFFIDGNQKDLLDKWSKQGCTVESIESDYMLNSMMVLPSIEEQREIVEYLEKETARIDRLVALNQQTIDKLKEYRTALITAAVTGKIDVRNWRQTETKGV